MHPESHHPHNHWQSGNDFPCHLHNFKLHVTYMSTLLPVAVIHNGKWSGFNAFFCVSVCVQAPQAVSDLSYTLIFCVKPHPVCTDLCASPQKKGWKGNGRGRAESGERGWECTEDVNICPRSPGLTCPCSCIGWAECSGERKPGKEGRG